MQDPLRWRFPGVTAVVLALVLVPLTPPGVAADSTYAASCGVLLRAGPSTSATALVTMTTGTVVTATATVAGGTWSASCPASVSGSTWYAISAVDGTSVSTLFGASVAYAATGLFQPSTSPPPIPAAYVEGVDVSNYRGSIDWTQVPASGKRFAIMRATLGTTYVDPTYAANHAGARAVGLPVAAYHYAKPSSAPGDAVLQADWFVENAAPVPGDLAPALDLEESGGLSPSALQAWVGAWLGEVYAKLGVRPMIYTSPTDWANMLGDSTMFADQGYVVLWIAHWATSSPTVPASNWGGHGWTFWQYSNCGTVAGIAGCVDLDRYNGTDVSSLAFNYTSAPPLPVSSSNPPPILTGIVPANVSAGGGDVTVAIEGARFASGISTVYLNGMPLATTYVSPTQLSAIVPAALTATPGTGVVTVQNPPLEGGISAATALLVVGPPTQLAFTTQPGGGLAGASWSQQPVVAVVDANNQVVTSDNTTVVTLTIATNPAGGTLSCSGTTVAVINGYASFSGCSISVGSPSLYQLRATSSSSSTPTTSNLFPIGSPQPVVFTTTTALGNTLAGPFTATTKMQKLGGYITWKIDGGPGVAGKTVELWVYKKSSPLGRWSGPIKLATRVANSGGVAYANVRASGILWLSLRPVLPATGATAAVWGPTSIGRWVR